MATTVFRRGKTYHGKTKVDGGYLRPQITDLLSAGGSVSEGHYSGSAPATTPSAPTQTVDLDTGKLWIYTKNEWVFSGITLAL